MTSTNNTTKSKPYKHNPKRKPDANAIQDDGRKPTDAMIKYAYSLDKVVEEDYSVEILNSFKATGDYIARNKKIKADMDKPLTSKQIWARKGMQWWLYIGGGFTALILFTAPLSVSFFFFSLFGIITWAVYVSIKRHHIIDKAVKNIYKQ